ncbi:hypothetical protein CWI75_08720 [Kineobactrum sediminis]|uniref:Phage terminase small subunit P27 family n=1 Tax=Kineobactrum sediminis TaxID=1905677 RepID=A0A2N5Y2P4_9GAMM|nr:hypothetical protein [Kineobactrum sediminis]PLW82657.1 hypothetical protein CWI75_08720 [Kineobactrum sediminis]
MAQRGKQSAAALAVATTEGRRPSPPQTLNDAQAAVWRRVVGVYPPEYFRPDSFDLLEAYCRHVVSAGFLNAEIDRYQPAWLLEDDGLKRYKTLLECRDRESRTSMALARSMRITNQSRFDERKAASTQRTTSARAPWETDE